MQEVLFETLIFDFYFEVIKVKYFRETKPFNIYELFGIRSQIAFQPELMVARYEHDTGIRNGKPEYLQEAQCLLYLLAHGESAPSTRIESGHGFKVYQIPIEYKDFGMGIPQELEYAYKGKWFVVRNVEIIYDYDACRVRQVFYQVLVGRTIVGFIVPDLCQDSLHYFIQRHVLNRWNIFNSFTLVVYFTKRSTSGYYCIPHLLEIIDGCIVGRVVYPYSSVFILVHPEGTIRSRMGKGSLIIGIRLLKTIVGDTESE